MDARVNDFLNEVNEITPLNETKEDNVWEKCFDEESGYYYYWNIETDKVTWEPPPGYKVSSDSKHKSRRASNLYMPPKSAPLFPSTSGILPPDPGAVKIYKIGESVASNVKDDNLKAKSRAVNINKNRTQPFRRDSDSEDEKIVLISSYGDDSDSETDVQNLNEKSKPSEELQISAVATSDDEDYTDILTKIQKRAKELKETDIESHSGTKKDVESNKTTSKLVLVAGYSDSEEESDGNFKPDASSPSALEERVVHSTLFPAAKAINVKDFENIPESSKINEDDNNLDSKAFQRKKRIGVALINTTKRNEKDQSHLNLHSERQGLGFSVESDSGSMNSNSYQSFKSGGISFIKSDVLNPTKTTEENSDKETEKTSSENSNKVLQEIGDIYVTLKEKLGFLSEGKEPVFPVQAMLIQIETLYDAFKSGDLKKSYLLNWLNDTCKDLIKLEKETTPEGWLLQWDRFHKRYYYQNATTGESQWEYPQTDVTRCDEAMDICTTPPRVVEQLSPPSPPKIRKEVTPPPPPLISDLKPNKKRKRDDGFQSQSKHKETSLQQSTPEGYINNGEPLPPGVDLDLSDVALPPIKETIKADLSEELNSFYSDLADIETSKSPPPSMSKPDPHTELQPNSDIQEPIKKKKKDKVKLTQGIAMKKKGVSQLVERWRNIQTQL